MIEASAFDADEFQPLLTGLYSRWQHFLTRSYPRLQELHADLMQQAAEDLVTYARKHAWSDIDDWNLLGFRILHRRIADHFRGQAQRWAMSQPLTVELPASDSDSDPERVAHYATQLQRLVVAIAELEGADRQLLLGDHLEGWPQTGLSDAERKRLSRLRSRLREQISHDSERSPRRPPR